MTGLLRPRLAQVGVIGKTGRTLGVGTTMHQSRDVRASLAGNVDFVFIKTQLSLGFRWNS